MSRGKGGNNRRRPFRHRDRNDDAWQDPRQREKRAGDSGSGVRSGEAPRSEKSRGGFHERLRWTAPLLSTEPLPVPDCPYCGKPIKDLSAAISDRNTGEPVHFDCVLSRISEGEALEEGEVVSYIGGGRFGVVYFANPRDPRNFTIKKILEWEDKENRASWRQSVSDHYSVT